jgi:DNA polymerase II small subunit
MDKIKKIEEMFNKGILLNEDLLEKELDNNLLQKIELEEDLIILNDDYVDIIATSDSLVDWYQVDKYRVDSEKDRDDQLYQTQLQQFKNTTLTSNNSQLQSVKQEIKSLEVELDQSKGSFTTNTTTKEDSIITTNDIIPQGPSSVSIVISHINKPHKYTIQDFTNFFLSRYKFIESILRNRQELQHPLTISRVLDKKDKETVSIIGLVENIGETKNGNLMLTIEDVTGKIKVLVSKNKKDLLLNGKDLVLDEVIGITGTSGDKIVFAEKIVWPDIPSSHEIKKGPDDEYVIFLSDIHVGSKLFMKDEFQKFIDWLRSETGNEAQREIAKKVKYIIIAGDLVDGIGIYPNQQDELEIDTIDGQYTEFIRLIKQIPIDKKIIMCPGNHDMVHLAEPQPIFTQEFAPGLFDLSNVILVTNPAVVNIGKTKDFSGFDILLYHGFSFDYYVANVESIRNNGGYHRSDLIMKFLLKRRHLAPSYKSTPYFPAHVEDPLLIRKIPDFFITGHIHYTAVANYKGITMISGSCWQAKTSFQEKLGHEPEPARVPIVNLKTREIKILRFG